MTIASHLFQVLLYYCYAPIEDPEQFAAEHLKFCKSLGLKGRVIVASEGLNGTVSGSPDACQAYMDHVHADPRFAKTDFKIDYSPIHAFQRMHVRHKSEIVHSGLRDPRTVDPNRRTGKHLKPVDFLEMKDRENVVILDVRSNYETEVGRFKNALTLDIENFRDFPEKVKELANLKDKTVITYCTGGIKCEKASAYLLEQGFEDVYQLEGGIIKYGLETGGVDFEGKCYVFDNRITVDVNQVNPTIISTCHHCDTPSSRMINCANPECNNHMPMCEECGWTMEGACSDECKTHPRKREYDGTGYYSKPPID